MYPSQVLLRPLTARVMKGAAGRYTRFPNPQHARGLLTLKDHVYFAKATAEGAGRNGIVKSNGDSPLELKMSTPKAAGGKGEGQNPEQLFAMGYSSCFLGALQLAASRANKKELAEKAKVHTSVFLGHPEDANLDGFGLRVEITVEGCDDDAIIAAAHEFCPYSRALKHGIDVKIVKAMKA
ncbi:OsmC-like protein [Panus rudis PR-1116 ss-1]|nr:OsmC-like protein [Panus rudis PR-1116 ss-1]